VQLYELGETPDGRLFAAFEYVEGGSLAAALGGRPRAAREAAELVRLLATALDRAPPSARPALYGDGRAGERVVAALRDSPRMAA